MKFASLIAAAAIAVAVISPAHAANADVGKEAFEKNNPEGLAYGYIGHGYLGHPTAVDVRTLSKEDRTKYFAVMRLTIQADLALYRERCGDDQRDFTKELREAMNLWWKVSEIDRKYALDYERNHLDKNRNWKQFCESMHKNVVDDRELWSNLTEIWINAKMTDEERDAFNKAYLEKQAEETKKKEAEQAKSVQQTQTSAHNHDFEMIWNVKENAITLDLAIKSDISSWNHSVDLTIGTRNQFTADAFADAVCHHANLRLIDKTWKARIYLADGTLGSECRITN